MYAVVGSAQPVANNLCKGTSALKLWMSLR